MCRTGLQALERGFTERTDVWSFGVFVWELTTMCEFPYEEHFNDWDLFDTRHVVYRPAKMSAETLEAGYWRAYRDFYRWSSIGRGAWTKPGMERAAASFQLCCRLEKV